MTNLAQTWLEQFVKAHGAVAGTVHTAAGDDLVLAAAVNIPPFVIERVRFVPHGKGMAGLAQTERAPVQTCNIKTDDSGTIKPAAKLVDANAAIAVPVLRGDRVEAVVGLAFAFVGDLPADLVRAIDAGAASVPLGEPAARGGGEGINPPGEGQ